MLGMLIHFSIVCMVGLCIYTVHKKSSKRQNIANFNISKYLLSCRNGCCAFCITISVHTMSKMATRVNIEC